MMIETADSHFEWDIAKEQYNIAKHGISFSEATKAFLDEKRIIAEDIEHSLVETRYYCFGKVEENVLTVRFTMRQHKIRIIGAGFWRKGRSIYEQARQSYLY